MVRILLTNPVNGYLDVKDGTAFPLNFSISDIRDISKRTGSYSKTITLVGNKNNNSLLGNIYDINLVDGSFNINTLQECIVEQDGIIILDNMYLQLTAVKKTQKSGSYDFEIEYEAQIRDSNSDFFSKISNLNLDSRDSNNNFILDFSLYDHTFNYNNVVDSFDNTIDDVYKYSLGWKQKTNTINNAHLNYDLKEFRPAIYAKQYWDKIFDYAGYTYTFEEASGSTIQFEKLIIPYNGEDVKVDENPDYIVEAELTGGTVTKTIIGGAGNDAFQSRISPNGSNSPTQFIFNSKIQDVTNQYNEVSGNYIPAFAITDPASLTFKFIIEYEIEINFGGAGAVTLMAPTDSTGGAGGNVVRPGFILRNNSNSTEQLQYFNTITIPAGTSYPAGTTSIGTDSISFELQATDLTTSTALLEKLYISVTDSTLNSVYPSLWMRSGGVVYANYNFKVTNAYMLVTPKELSLDYNMEVPLNKFILKGIRQSDFIKSITQMFNLYIEPNPSDKTNLIIKTRDKFYDDGIIIDWTNKLAKDKEQDIQFLPELSSKKLILTYKQDNDVANKGYLDRTNEIYGQLEYVFENEYVRNIEKKELIFSPTPVEKTGFNAVVPIINGFEPKTNIRILIDCGIDTCETYYIKENQIFSASTTYPVLSHFDAKENPSFDINFGKCDFYFYDPTPDSEGTQDVTNNNLFNLHWRRTLSQINNGKLLTADFYLTPVDIQKLKLNQKIRIDNSYWFINKISDYNANSNELTRVELISDENDSTIDFYSRDIGNLTITDSPLIDVINNGANGTQTTNLIINGTTTVNGNSNFVTQNNIGNVNGDDNFVNTNGVFAVNGNGNILNSPTIINGNNNTVGYETTNVFINGSNNTVDSGLQNVSLFVNSYSAITGNTFVVPNNFIIQSGQTISGVTIPPTINGIAWPDGISGYTGGWPAVLAIDNTSGPTNPVLTNGASIGGGEDPSVAIATNILYLGDSTVNDGTWYLGDLYANSSEIRFDGTDAHFENAVGYTRISGNNIRLDSSGEIFIVTQPLTGSSSASILVRELSGEIREIGLSAITSSSANTWSQVLSNGNTSGPNDAIINSGQKIKGEAITGPNLIGSIPFLDFDSNANNSGIITLSNDDSGGLAQALKLNGANGEVQLLNDIGLTTVRSSSQTKLEAANSVVYLNINQLGNINSNAIEIGLDSTNNQFEILINDNTTDIATSGAIDKKAIFIGTNNSTIDAGVTNSVIIGGSGHLISSNDSTILGGVDNTLGASSTGSMIAGGNDVVINSYGCFAIGDTVSITDTGSQSSVILGGSSQEITNASFESAIIGGTSNRINGAIRTVVLGGNNIADATYDNTVYQQDSYRDAGNHTVTTTNNTITNLYTFTPDSNGVWIIEANVTGFENATGDAIGAKSFATFKVIAGAVTAVSTNTLDRKSNFPAGVTVTIDTDGTVIRIRVTGRTGSTIDWRSSLTITK